MNKKITNNTVNNNTSKGANNMLNTTAITNALVNLGYKDVKVVTVTKNGVNLTGVTYRREGSNVAPTVYIDGCKNETEAVERCRYGFDQPIPDVCIDPFANVDKSRIKARICGKGKSGTDVKKSWLDLEIYAVYEIRMSDGIGTIRINQNIISNYFSDMTTDAVLALAISNSFKACQVRGIQEYLAALVGQKIAPIEKDMAYILTDSNKGLSGAINMLNTQAISALADMYGDDVYILPASIHEVIVLPVLGHDPSDVRTIVGVVNDTELSPEDKLSDSVYIFTRKNKVVAIA